MQACCIRALTLSSQTTTSASVAKFHSKTLISHCLVYTATSNAIHGSNYYYVRFRGRSFAALPHSESPESQRGRKRVTRDQRRAMVKAFVDKYRASNAGKYPTPTAAQKQVGGSYYIIKNIIQELEFNSKRSPTDTSKKDKILSQEECLPSQESTEGDLSNTDATDSHQIDLESNEVLPKEECLPSMETIEVPSSTSGADLNSSTQSLGRKDDSQTIVINNIDMDESTSYTFEVKEEFLASTEISYPEDALDPKTIIDPSKFDGTNGHQINPESEDVTHVCTNKPEASQKAATFDGSLDLSEPEVVQEIGQEAIESDKLKRSQEPKDISEKDIEEQQSLNRSTVWGSLRYFADGIINLWRKM